MHKIRFLFIVLIALAIIYLLGFLSEIILIPQLFWAIWGISMLLVIAKLLKNDETFTIIGYVITFLLGLMAIPIQQRFLSPHDMSIEFKLEKPFVINTMTAGKSNDNLYKIYPFRFEIINNSLVNASNCIPKITRYWHTNENDKQDEEINFEPLRIGWSDNARVDIPPGGKLFVTFLKISEVNYQLENEQNLSGDPNKPQVRFFAPSWPRWISSHIPPGEHSILVTIYFDNRRPLQQKFNIKWSGIWQDDYTSILKELVITKETERVE